jgi:phosphatidate cytidylyltransferase
MAEPARPKSNLALRLLTAAVTAPLIVLLLYVGPPWGFPLVAGIVCALGAWELFTMLAPGQRLLQLWGVAASSAVYALFAVERGQAFATLAMILLSCGGMLVVLVQPEPIERAALRMGWAVAGPLYIGGLFATTALLFRQPNGGSWVLLALLCAFWSDTGGYFVGRHYGKHKLAPVVSPKKTVEGAIGGLAAALIGGLLAHFWFLRELPLLDAIGLSLAAAGIGQAGDLCESLIKRSVGVKDSGTVLPGHGGILDRSDAMLFSAATIWVYVALLRS